MPLQYRGGAYASDGTLIPESCLWRLLASGMDCATVPYPSLPDPTASLSVGVFGGTLFPHFVHLMVESTARSWWLLKNEPSLPLILQFQAETDVVPSYFQKLFALAGIKTHIVPRGHLVEVKRLIIPEPALVERKHAHPDFLLFFDKVRTAALSHGKYPDYGTHLFVMRGQGVAQVFGEDVVSKELERQGYRMLDPSVVSMEEQISAFAGATHIVGSIGSAMHNVVYANKAQKVAYLVRTGSVSTTFPSIDQACGLYEAHYLYVGLTPLPVHGPLKGPYLIDAEMACHHLFEAGFLPHRVNLTLSDVIASRDAYMAQWAAGAPKQP
ncbi:MAG: glycosyltransferase family 61 protein [Pseudotabrizicola sp.]|uniref:glycosyltransferase family 61 protein n=2 Tax=Pseudotabrizicola sp. TaxID=2939647 RepID=UPI002765E108|nr:glycosyltransferase family 61 protein [Pseudotabrizicola sp.]MDP2080160.1 glycosyltransferase family 61 protein [Pseudotabrizicola sp.]MDZ7574981.1 glycosyltransferase family 61 protein [Pseudotabrizicola sp.]